MNNYTKQNKVNTTPFDVLVKENIAGLLYLENDTIVFSNPSFIEIFESDEATIVGSSILDWVGGNCTRVFKEKFNDIITGEREEFSENLRRKNGENAFFSLHLRVVGRKDGVVSIVGASRNSTERVTKNRALENQEIRYNSLFDNSLAGIIIYNYDTERIVKCNKAALKLMNYGNMDELIGTSRFTFVPARSEFFPGVDMHKEAEEHGRKIKHGIPFNTPGSFLTKDGREFLVQANVTPTFNEYGEGFIIFHDVTNQVLNKKAKKEIEKKYKDIFENSNESIVYWDLNTAQATLCNDNALKLFEVASIEELQSKNIGAYILEDSLESKDSKEFLRKSINNALEEGRAEIAFWTKKKDGRLLRINGLLISNKSNPNSPKIIAFLRDVTFMHNAQISLNDKNKELERYIDSNMQLENFAYLASHDLQTPLRSIISFTQLLEKKLGDRLSEEEKEYLTFIVDSGRNMRELIYDLLSYSRVNTTMINLEDIDLRKLLQQVNGDLSYDLREKNAVLEMYNLPQTIKADASKLKQIFQNLIVNAIKFSKEDIQPVVALSCEETSDFWKFSVSDNGIGIEKEYQEKIFLLFKRLNGIDQYEGTGIGLSMVKKLVEQHSGEIRVESNYGEGATFYFTIKK